MINKYSESNQGLVFFVYCTFNVEIRNTKLINWTEQSVYVLEGDKQHTLFISQTYFLMDLKLDPNTNVKSLPL